MAGDVFFESMLDSVRNGKVSETRINEAAEQIIFVKYLLGLFDVSGEDPDATVETESVALRCHEHLEVAHEGAVKSLVLLKNDEDILPFADGAKSVLVTGPLADTREMLGDWVKTAQQRGVETIRESFDRLKPDGWSVEFADSGSVLETGYDQIDAACDKASQADYVVAIVGENSFRWAEEPKTSGENCDRASLFLPGRQIELIERLHETGIPVVVVLVTSRANAIPTVAENASAVLMAWEPGFYTGEAIAEAVFGEFSPSGRLPISMPRSSGHLKCVYDRPPLRLSHYGDSEETPLFPFGHGLGYSPVRLSRFCHDETILPGDDLHITFEVTNEGAMDTDYIVLVFLRDVVSSVTTPERKLCAYKRIAGLSPGEMRSVSLTVESARMALVNETGEWVIEPGQFDMSIDDWSSSFEVRASANRAISI